MNLMKKMMAIVIIVLLVGCACVGCSGDAKNTTYDNYSYGLTEKGMYENFEKHIKKLPDFKSLSFTCDEVLEWGVKNVENSGHVIETVDEYVYIYGEELLTMLELTNKTTSVEGDRVSIDFEFYINGVKLDDFSSSGTYEASQDGDEIVKSLIGRSIDEEYEVEYVFPEDDADYANETSTVKIKVTKITDGSPIKNGVVDANLDVIAQYLDGVTDNETYLAALRPILAETTLPTFIQNYIQNEVDIELPSEFVEYEDYRLRFRLQQIGYEYEDYLKAMEMTEEDLYAYYEQLVRENYVCMLYFHDRNLTITYADLASYYGDNFDYIKSVQGEPYMRLALMREMVVQHIADDIVLIGVDDIENKDRENDDNTQQESSASIETTPTEITTEPTANNNVEMSKSIEIKQAHSEK
jgi:hypothetical protein